MLSKEHIHRGSIGDGEFGIDEDELSTVERLGARSNVQGDLVDPILGAGTNDELLRSRSLIEGELRGPFGTKVDRRVERRTYAHLTGTVLRGEEDALRIDSTFVVDRLRWTDLLSTGTTSKNQRNA